MFELFRTAQLNIMLCLSSICGVAAFFTYLTVTLTKKRRNVLMYFELSAMFLLIFDRFAYIYRGDVSRLGFVMVRVSNFFVFLLTVLIMHGMNLYLVDLLKNDAGIDPVPVRLRINEIFLLIAAGLVVVSQFTGLYYTFDESNRYVRSPGFVIGYIVPILVSVIQFSVIIQYRNQIGRFIRISILMFISVHLSVSVIQIFTYGLSLIDCSLAANAFLLYVFSFMDLNDKARKAEELRYAAMKEERSRMDNIFGETLLTFVNAIDERSGDTQGHSQRVAQYSKTIASVSGKSEEECKKIYYSALLHDVGRIGIPESILNKDGDLSEEERDLVKKQPMIGSEILSEIKELPFLKTAALYHRERFDGKGYPGGLKGEEIPEMGRIVAVADAYDSMTSGREDGEPMPQQVVREEIVKGSGTRFDPRYAAIMRELIDNDSNYQMVGEKAGFNTVWQTEFRFNEYRSGVSYGIAVTPEVIRISFSSSPDGEFKEEYSVPSIILFDSLDGHVHDTLKTINDTLFVEYGEIWFDGHHVCSGARDMNMTYIEDDLYMPAGRYVIEASKYRDHAKLTLRGGGKRQEIITALADSSRAVYIALTGEHCFITDIEVEKTGEKTGEGDIERIADEISYIDRMESDLSNVQIDGYRTAATESVPVKDDMRIIFHARSLPTANLVWHCPFIILFHSDDAKVYGQNYRELALIRLDGEAQPFDEAVENKLTVEKSDEFMGWDAWKEYNKKGFECEVVMLRNRKRVTVITENAGISIKNITTVSDQTKDVYLALSGDQCALTDIRIARL